MVDLEMFLNNKLTPEEPLSFGTSIFVGTDGHDVHALVLRDIEHFCALVDSKIKALSVVIDFSRELQVHIEDIQAAYQDPIQMLVIDMALGERVSWGAGILENLKREVEKRRIKLWLFTSCPSWPIHVV